MNKTNIKINDSSGFRCISCGVCCRMQPPDVNQTEQKQIEAIGFKNFLDQPDRTGIRWVKRKKDGACWFLTDNNQCAIYTVRPAICRLEPFTIVDYEYKYGKVELALNFPFSCCCPGVGSKENLPVEELGRAAQVLVQKILALTASDLGLPVSAVVPKVF